MTHSVRLLSALAITSIALVACLDAQQIPFSQHGKVMQRVGFTEISITYNRPVARGRTLFGDVVNWGRIWNPGADSATTLSFSRAVSVDGHRLEAGRYTLWMVPNQNEPWTVIFSRAVDIYHTPYPGEEHDALRLAVPPERGAHMEALAYYFPVVVQDSTELRMHWGETIVPLGIKAPWRP